MDVGGGNGQQCVELLNEFPSLKGRGRIVLQDRKDVLEKAIVEDGIERMAYDYLTEQPVKGTTCPLSNPSVSEFRLTDYSRCASVLFPLNLPQQQ